MGRLLTITATGQGKAGIRKRTLSRRTVAVGPVSVQLVVVIVGTLLGLFYLIQSNRVSTQSLELKALENQKTQVVEENERLSIEAARLQSIQQIKKSAEQTKAEAAAKAVSAKQAAAAGTDQNADDSTPATSSSTDERT